jgi:hypothetical protein
LYNCSFLFIRFPSHVVFLLLVQLQLLIHLPPVSSRFRLHTHVLRSLLRVFYALPKVQHTCTKKHNCRLLQRHFRDVTQRPARITAITLSRMNCAGSHLLSCNRHPLTTKKVKKVEKSNILAPYIRYGLFQTKGQMCTKFGSDRFRNVNLYKVQTNIQTNFQLYI